MFECREEIEKGAQTNQSLLVVYITTCAPDRKDILKGVWFLCQLLNIFFMFTDRRWQWDETRGHCGRSRENDRRTDKNPLILFYILSLALYVDTIFKTVTHPLLCFYDIMLKKIPRS